MALDPVLVETAATLFRNAAFIALYFFLGTGAGFVVGIILSNLIWGRGPTLVQVHKEGLAAAAEHNKQWAPSHPRWSQEQ